MTGRPLLVIFIIAVAFTASAQAASIPLIIQRSPTASISAIAASLGATVVDSIPGADTYLLNVPFALPSSLAPLLGIQWLELNTGVTLPGFVQVGVLSVPANTAADWYKHQP